MSESRPAVWDVLLLALFFLSGATSLAYEILWTKVITFSIGTNVIAVSAVISSFMGGLAVGAYTLGKKVDRSSRPLRVYALLELCIGVWALLMLPLLRLSSPLYARLQFLSGLTGVSHDIVIFFLAFIPLLPPAVLMGGTFPALLSHMERSAGRREESFGASVSLLYGINTIGAVFGTLMCGFLLIGRFGITSTNQLTVSTNIAVFIIALAFSFRREPLAVTVGPRTKDAGQTAAGSQGKGRIPSRRRLLIILYAASGFTALAYEVVWTRILVHYVGTTSYAFTLMLAIFLFGIGLGSFVYRILHWRVRFRTFHFGVLEFIIGLSGSLGLLAVSALSSFHYQLIGSPDHMWWYEAVIILAASGSLMLVPTFLFGLAFPMVSRLISRGRSSAGEDVGTVYSANTLGSIAGAVLTALLFIPLLGSGGSVLFFSAVNLVIAGTAFLVGAERRALFFGTVTFVFAILVPALVPSSIYRHMFPEEVTLFAEEGPEATVAVIKDQSPLSLEFKRMIVDGNALSGSDYSGRRYMRLLGHLPLLLCDDPERVLVICLGTGMTLGACSRNEDVHELYCVEISREVVKAARQFTMENYAVLEKGKARVMTGDGRNFLLSYPGSLDVITLEPPPPRARGVVNLYSKDFYELCLGKLSERGVMAQWIPLHDQGVEDVKTLIKTFTSVFNNTTAWLIERHDLCLIGTVKPLEIEIPDLRTRFSRVKEALNDIDITSVWGLLSMYLADNEGLDRYCGDVPVVSDDLPIIEHFLSLPWNSSIMSVPRGDGMNAAFLDDLLLYRRPLLNLIVHGVSDDDASMYLRQRLAMDHFLQGVIYSDMGLPSRGLEEIRIARRLVPWSEYFRHYLGISTEQRRELEDLLVKGRGDAGQILSRYGYLEFEEGNYEKAREIFGKTVSLFPDEAAGYLHLAMTYEKLGDLESSRMAYERVAQIDPGEREGIDQRIQILAARRKAELSGELSDLDALAVLYWKSRRYEDAAEIFAEMVRMVPGSELARYNLASAQEALGFYSEALDEYRVALEIDPGVKETLNNIAKLKMFLAVTGERIEEVDLPDGSRVTADPADAASYAILGRLYARNDEYMKAEHFLRRALAIRPDYAEAQSMLLTVEDLIENETGIRMSGEKTGEKR